MQFQLWLNSGFAMEIFLIIGLIYAYLTTISILRKNHGKRYDEIKDSMKYFYIIEIFPLILTVLLDIYGTVYYYFNNSEIKIQLDLIRIVWSLYPLFQAYGMLSIKESKDPLSGISKLDQVIIMSKYQVKLASFKSRITTKGADFRPVTADK